MSRSLLPAVDRRANRFLSVLRTRHHRNGRAPYSRRSLCLEQLEQRQLLTVTAEFLGTPFLTSGNDVNASQLAGSQPETHIAVNPTNPGNLVVMSNGGAATNEFTAYSSDAGSTFTSSPVGNAQDGQGAAAGASRFDGAVAIDSFGNIHIVYMARPVSPGPSAIVYGLSSDGGQNYVTTNIVSPPASIDKPWIAVGPDAATPGNQAVLITYRDAAGRIVATAASASALGTIGAFSAPAFVSDPGGSDNYAVPAIGPNGEFAVTWQDPAGGQGTVNILGDWDLDGLVGGLAFGADTIITTSDSGGFDFIPATPDRAAFASPYFAYDRSGGAFSGRLYLAYADEAPDESDDFDIIVRHSDDNGVTWSGPVQVNDDTGTNSQFFQNISVDPLTGVVYLGWYDARNDRNDGLPGDIDSDNSANSEVEYFASASLDGGLTFLPNIQVSDGSSDEDRADPNTNDFGDYTGIAAYAGSAFADWPDNSNSTGDNPAGNTSLDVYVDRVVLRSTGGQLVSICGDEDFANQDDLIRLTLDASGTFLQVYVNGVLEFTGTLAAIQQINVFAAGGNDTLIVDSTNGLITVPAGIRYDGDHGCPDDVSAGIGGFDRLDLVQTGGSATGVGDTLAIGATNGSGRSVITGPGGTQTVDFQYLEPVVDTVPAATFAITSVAGLASLLQAANTINLSGALLIPPPAATIGARVTVDAFEPIEFANKAALVIDAGSGDDRFFSNLPVPATGLTSITVNGGDGNDYLQFVQVPDAATTSFLSVTANGDAGNDSVDASQVAVATPFTIDGGGGNDTLAGGLGNDGISGGDGDDVLSGNGGSNTFNGGAGFDTILVQGTPGNDRIDINQTAAAALSVTVNALVESDTLVLSAGVRTVEALSVQAGDGDDIIRVTHNDGLGVDANVNSLRIDVHGGAAATRDRLAVVDQGTGDLVLYRKGELDSSGSITVGPRNAEPLEVTFDGIETIQPIAAVGGQVVVFKHDPFEFNDDRLLATHLGANDTLNVDPTIDPGPDPIFGFPADQDWYRVEAQYTGTLDFQVFFRDITTVPSGRPGLPGNGDLDIQVYDASGVAISGSASTDDNERVRIPAVQGQVYYLQVFGFSSAINSYSITTINLAPPVPYAMELLDNPVGDPPPANSDTGRSQFDNITRDSTPTLVFRLDDAIFLHDLPGNPANNNPPDRVIPISFQPGPGQPLAPGYAIAIYDEGSSPPPGNQVGTAPQVFLGFATATAQEGVYQFTTPGLSDGSHFLTARVQMIDPATPTETGLGGRSVPLEIVVDTAPPPVFFGNPADPTDGLAVDPGVTPQPPTFVDNKTNDTTPTFWGTAEADAIIRVYADLTPTNGIDNFDVLLGLTVAVPLDGTNQFPNGQWRVTSTVNLNDPAYFPVDGLRRILVTAEDVAGNLNPGSEEPAQAIDIFLDTQGPQVFGVFFPRDPVLLAINTANRLVRFRASAPGTLLGSVQVSGLAAGETLVGIDLRPADGRVYGVVNGPVTDRLVTIDPYTGVASPVANLSVALSGSQFGVDFNPVVDRLRVVSDLDQNLRINPDTGAVTVDTALNPANPTVVAAAYTNNTVGAGSTALYAIDTVADTLRLQNPANSGALTTIGALGIDATNSGGFDIAPELNTAYAALRVGTTTQLYQIDLATGAATAIGPIGLNQTIFGLTALPPYDVFDPKPSTDGPTPLVTQIAVRVEDLPARVLEFQNPAVNAIVAVSPGLYRLTGDANGNIPIASVEFLPDPFVAGQPASGTLVLHFAKPIPDDRYTLTIDDALVDDVGNRLDGESNAAEPQEQPHFPSGDGQPGGDFVARFTVDSRPEIASWNSGNVYVDTNGNFHFDPTNVDYTNRDLTYQFGTSADNVFAGNFVAAANGVADGFSKLGAYGRVNGQYRWLIDTDNDGVFNLNINDPANVNGLPVAYNFDNNAINGDEVGLFAGNTLTIDNNHDFQVNQTIQTGVTGYAVVGDFDKDGKFDVITYRDDTFFADLGANGYGQLDRQFTFITPFPTGVRERPVAADMDQDGYTDLGLWVPDRTGAGAGTAEWYILISGGHSILDRLNPLNQIAFSQDPLGKDLFSQFGGDFALPVIGNFDPPTTPGRPAPGPVTVVRNGTSGNDMFRFSPGPGANKWSLSVNGVVETFTGSSIDVTFVGGGGTDTASLGGSSGIDLLTTQPGKGELVGRGYRVNVTVENVIAYGGGGADVAKMNGGSANDTFTAQPTWATMVGPGYSSRANNFPTVIADGGGGSNSATLTGSAGNDRLDAQPMQARLTGAGFSIQAAKFKSIVARGVGGRNTANLADSALLDLLTAGRTGSTRWVNLSNQPGAAAFNLQLEDFAVTASLRNSQDRKQVPQSVDFLMVTELWR